MKILLVNKLKALAEYVDANPVEYTVAGESADDEDAFITLQNSINALYFVENIELLKSTLDTLEANNIDGKFNDNISKIKASIDNFYVEVDL